jgi:hypothetical protein
MPGKWTGMGRTVNSNRKYDWDAVACTSEGELIAVGGSFSWRFFPRQPGIAQMGWYPRGMLPLRFLREHTLTASTLTPLSDGTLLAIGVNHDYVPNGSDNRTVAAVYEGFIWREVAAPPVACMLHSATLLRNGMVMVAGGQDPNYQSTPFHPESAIADTQLFEPRTRKWRSLPPLRTARHGAALIPIGPGMGAMILGGLAVDANDWGPTASIEIFTESAGWREGEPMQMALHRPAAVILKDGRVVVPAPQFVMIYDPASGRWEDPVPTLFECQGYPTGLLSDGTVLIDHDQVYDPARRKCIQVASNAVLDTYDVPCCTTPSGDVVALIHTAPERERDARQGFDGTSWRFDIRAHSDDPMVGKWIDIGDPPYTTPSPVPMLATLPGGHVLATNVRESWRYDRTEWKPAGTLPIDLFDRLFCSLISLKDGGVLAIGYNTNFDPNSNRDYVLTSAYTQAAGWSAPSRVVVQRSEYASALLSDGRVMVSGGFDVTKAKPVQDIPAFRSAELYDPKAGMWRETIPMRTPRMSHALAALPNQLAVIAFGGITSVGADEILNTAEMWIVENGAEAWIPLPSMQYHRDFPSALALPDGRVIVASEDALEVFDSRTRQWEPPVALMSWAGPKPIMGLLRDGSVLIGNDQTYDPVERSCRLVTPLPAPSLNPGFCVTALATVMVWPEQPSHGKETVWEFDIGGR